jgi:hypothetical protein
VAAPAAGAEEVAAAAAESAAGTGKAIAAAEAAAQGGRSTFLQADSPTFLQAARGGAGHTGTGRGTCTRDPLVVAGDSMVGHHMGLMEPIHMHCRSSIMMHAMGMATQCRRLVMQLVRPMVPLHLPDLLELLRIMQSGSSIITSSSSSSVGL